MEEVLVANGGRVSKEVCKDTTHLVVDEQSVEALPDELDIPAGCQIPDSEGRVALVFHPDRGGG